MIAAAEKTGVNLMFAQTWRFNPADRKAKQLLDAGEIGELIWISWTRLMPPYGSGPDRWFRWRSSGGGFWVWEGTHFTDQIRWFAGDEFSQAYSAGMGNYVSTGDGEDNGIGAFKFAGGAFAVVMEGNSDPGSEPRRVAVRRHEGDDRGGQRRGEAGEGRLAERRRVRPGHERRDGRVRRQHHRGPPADHDRPGRQSVAGGHPRTAQVPGHRAGDRHTNGLNEGLSMDRVTTARRSHIMSRVPSTDSTPELLVRKFLHRSGLRYRLHVKNLPGRPDIVLVSLRLAIFVHGCFWHGHRDCPKGRLPKTRLDYWGPKIAANHDRDSRVAESLAKQGWRVEPIWQCETKDRKALARRLSLLVGRKIADE